MKNRYIHRAKISENKFKQVLQLFCLGLNASQIADVAGINRNTINRYLTGIRDRISWFCRCQAEMYFYGHMFKDEPEFPKSESEISFLGIAKDNGNIRSRIIPEDVGCRLHTAPGTLTMEEENRTISRLGDVNSLIDLKRMRYIKIWSGINDDNGRLQTVDICDGFWGFIRGRMQNFRGLRKSTRLLHIRECEFRYNYRREEIFEILLEAFRKNPLFQ